MMLYKSYNGGHENVLESFNGIYKNNPEITLTTDACNTGWGAVLGKLSAAGLFEANEAQLHINVLELKAVLFGFQALCGHMYHLSIL